MKAVEDGWTTVGIQTKDGVILAAEKKIQNKLQIPSSLEKVTKIDDTVICTYSGLLSDARALIEYARVEAANHWFTFNEHMPVESISLSICDIALSFADKDNGDWGLGIGDWAQSPIPNPQSPIPNPLFTCASKYF
jgi:20S proteasome subunit alpha 5